MELQEVGKFALYIAISISIVGVSYQIMRLLSALTGNIKDLRQTVKNVGKITDELIEDQKLMKQGIQSFVNVGKKAEESVELISVKVIKPFTEVFGFLKTLKGTIGKVTDRFS